MRVFIDEGREGESLRCQFLGWELTAAASLALLVGQDVPRFFGVTRRRVGVDLKPTGCCYLEKLVSQMKRISRIWLGYLGRLSR